MWNKTTNESFKIQVLLNCVTVVPWHGFEPLSQKLFKILIHKYLYINKAHLIYYNYASPLRKNNCWFTNKNLRLRIISMSIQFFCHINYYSLWCLHFQTTVNMCQCVFWACFNLFQPFLLSSNHNPETDLKPISLSLFWAKLIELPKVDLWSCQRLIQEMIQWKIVVRLNLRYTSNPDSTNPAETTTTTSTSPAITITADDESTWLQSF